MHDFRRAKISRSYCVLVVVLNPVGLICILVALSEPSELAVPLTTMFVPAVKSADEPEIVLVTGVAGVKKIFCEPPLGKLIDKLFALTETTCPITAPPPTRVPTVPPAPRVKADRAAVAADAALLLPFCTPK